MMRLIPTLIVALLLSWQAAANDKPGMSLEKIAEGVWVHKSYHIIKPWGPILSQGLVVRHGDGFLLVDTSWTDEQTIELISLIETELGALPTHLIATHAHYDKMGGIGAANRAGIKTYALDISNRDAPDRNLTPAANSIKTGDAIALTAFPPDMENSDPMPPRLEIYYPGPGHTRDNIVIYHPPTNSLFVGCLVRPGNAITLGNTEDADLGHWALAVSNVKTRYPEANIVIPSHGPWGDVTLLDHTIALIEAARDN